MSAPEPEMSTLRQLLHQAEDEMVELRAENERLRELLHRARIGLASSPIAGRQFRRDVADILDRAPADPEGEQR